MILEKFKTLDGRIEDVVNQGELQQILNTNATEVSKLCQKACLKPKKDALGNSYFSKSDIDVLKKVKELYEHTTLVQAKRHLKEHSKGPLRTSQGLPDNFLTRAKNRLKNELSVPARQEQGKTQLSDLKETINASINTSLANLETNIIERFTSVLSEKMDGLDEVVVELIRAKTENETLRQKINELNKENFNLKNENTSYKSVGLGLYLKKNTDDFVL